MTVTDQELRQLERNNDLAHNGWVCAAAFPLFGFGAGLVLMARRDDRGAKITLASVAGGVAWYVVFALLFG